MKSLFIKIDNYCKLAQQTAFPFAEEKIEPVKSVVPSVSPPVPSTPLPAPQVIQPVPHVQAPIVEKCDAPGCQQPASDWYNDPDNEGNHFCRAHLRECPNCQEWTYVGEMIKDPNGATGTNLYCKDCAENIFTICPHCGETVNKENILVQPRGVRSVYNMKNGGCTDCAVQCYQCNKVIDKDSAYMEDHESWCENCYCQAFATCKGCGNSIDRDSSIYIDGDGDFCEYCFGKIFVICEGCKEPVRKTEYVNIGGDDYCEECAKRFKPETHYKPYMENFDEFSYTKKDRFLNQIYKLLPISVKELKAKHQQIANGLNDLIIFAKGKDITHEIVQAYRATLDPEEFPVDYSVWSSSLQRSVQGTNKPQLVINIISSPEMDEKFNSNPVLADLFKRINYLSEQSGHPMVEDQIGWARVEIDPNNEYLLVDEIQSDHSNGSHRLKNDKGADDVKQVRVALKNTYKLDDESFDKVLQQYNDILKDFPNIATQAITKFAQQNKIKKIYWHTYESGKALKNNQPPRSLYDKTPRENFFAPTEEKPFGLQGDFFGKEAKRADRMMRLAKKLYLTYFVK